MALPIPSIGAGGGTYKGADDYSQTSTPVTTTVYAGGFGAATPEGFFQRREKISPLVIAGIVAAAAVVFVLALRK